MYEGASQRFKHLKLAIFFIQRTILSQLSKYGTNLGANDFLEFCCKDFAHEY
jgi:hypothetical protein